MRIRAFWVQAEVLRLLASTTLDPGGSSAMTFSSRWKSPSTTGMIFSISCSTTMAKNHDSITQVHQIKGGEAVLQ